MLYALERCRESGEWGGMHERRMHWGGGGVFLVGSLLDVNREAVWEQAFISSSLKYICLRGLSPGA